VRARPLRETLPLWAVAAITALLLALVYMFASFALNRHSDPTFAAILALKAGAAPQPAPAAPAAPAPARLAHFLADEIQAGRVAVRDLPDRSIVTARGDGLFEPASATLSPAFTELLERIGQAVARVDGSVLVRGHTDNRPIRSARFPSNWHLSQARADAVAAALAPLGARAQVKTEGSADSEP
jgi:type VI secretion system protein ImpK